MSLKNELASLDPERMAEVFTGLTDRLTNEVEAGEIQSNFISDYPALSYLCTQVQEVFEQDYEDARAGELAAEGAYAVCLALKVCVDADEMSEIVEG